MNQTLNYWPVCTECRTPMEFDRNEPFAYCKCGTSEWGHPRPAPDVQMPTTAEQREAALIEQMHQS
jgi:hypothetical protein